jgi:hypothetical protein
VARRMRYVAQAFRGPALTPGEPLPFLCATDAEEGGAILAREAQGVLVYQQLVDPEGPIFDEPEILRVWGRVPAEALGPDGAAGDPWLDDAA